MSLTYENLVGGSGRSVFFRQKRYRAQSLMAEVMASVELDDVPALLQDVSVTGLAVRIPESSAQPPLGAIVALSVKLRDQVAFSGQAQVVRADREARWTTLGINFVESLLDPSALKVLHDRVVVEDAVAGGSEQFADVPQDYRQLCGDVSFFLTYWRTTLEQLDRNRLTNRFSAEFAEELEMAAERRMRREWADLRSKRKRTHAIDPARLADTLHRRSGLLRFS